MKRLFFILIVLVFYSCNVLDLSDNSDILSMVNEARTSGYGDYDPVGVVEWSSVLEKAAFIQSSYMDSTNDYNHVWKDGTQLKDRLVMVGYSKYLEGQIAGAENIAWGHKTEESVMIGWLESPGHCRNIMSGYFNIVGVSRVGNYWTMVLGRK